MSDYSPEQESIDIERYQIAKNSLTCVSCEDSFKEDGDTEWHYIIDDIWCHQCVIDGGLEGHTYG